MSRHKVSERAVMLWIALGMALLAVPAGFAFGVDFSPLWLLALCACAMGSFMAVLLAVAGE